MQGEYGRTSVTFGTSEKTKLVGINTNVRYGEDWFWWWLEGGCL